MADVLLTKIVELNVAFYSQIQYSPDQFEPEKIRK